jgi:hypothetical protein
MFFMNPSWWVVRSGHLATRTQVARVGRRLWISDLAPHRVSWMKVRARVAGSELHQGEKRLASQLYRKGMRLTHSPFTSRHDRPLIVHCHTGKAGTVWFRSVLMSVAHHYGLSHHALRRDPGPILPATDLVFGTPAWFRREDVGVRSIRGSHVIRDPRDLVISGYEYHKRTTEEWCLRPNPRRTRGLSFQAELLELNEHDGIMAEIDYVARRTGAELGAWNYEQSDFLEVRYEDAFADDIGTFERLFRWYGFSQKAIEVGMDAVERVSLKRGGARPGHARSGEPGEWRSRFSADHIERFKLLTGDLVYDLGYEANRDW